MTIILALLAAGTAASAGPAPLNPAAAEFFARDPALERWAVAGFDSNRDGWLTTFEAQPALAAFKQIADADRDGRVTVREYEEAKAFVTARIGSAAQP